MKFLVDATWLIHTFTLKRIARFPILQVLEGPDFRGPCDRIGCHWIFQQRRNKSQSRGFLKITPTQKSHPKNWSFFLASLLPLLYLNKSLQWRENHTFLAAQFWQVQVGWAFGGLTSHAILACVQVQEHWDEDLWTRWNLRLFHWNPVGGNGQNLSFMTPPKTNMEPENHLFEKENHLRNLHF